VGGLIGLSFTDTIITNSYSTAEISGVNYVGGLIGYQDYGPMTNCYAQEKLPEPETP